MIGIISSAMIPFLVFFIVLYGFYKKIDVYDVFIDGCKESFDLILNMFPCLLAMFLGVNIFLNSDILTGLFQVLDSLAILNHLFESFGPDSYIGILGSVIQGSTDTTFYILTLYFGSVGIYKIRYSLWAGLCADFIGVIVSVIVVQLLF